MPFVEAAARSHTGCVRKQNEDNFYLNGVSLRPAERDIGGLYSVQQWQNRQIYAVSDGMGGLDGGERASWLTVSHLNELLPPSANVSGSRFNNHSGNHSGNRFGGCFGNRFGGCFGNRFGSRFSGHIQAYVNRISDEISGGMPVVSSGCTMALVYLDGKNGLIAHIGDSRVYFKRKRKSLSLATLDHTQAVWLASRGLLPSGEKEANAAHHTLRRFVGSTNDDGRKVDISENIRLRSGDVFLLCSDGLSNLVSIQEMEQLLAAEGKCAYICQQLTSLALARGGYDNITVVMVRIA